MTSRLADQLVSAIDSAAKGVALFWRRKDRPDVIIATVPGALTLISAHCIGFLLRVPVVVDLRDTWPDVVEETGLWYGSRSKKISRVKHALIPFASAVIRSLERHSAGGVATSVQLAETLRRRGLSKVSVVRSGPSPMASRSLGAPDLVHRELRILYAGTVGRSQGLETALAAVNRLTARGVEVQMRVIGSGAELANLQELAAAHGAPVEFIPRCSRDELQEHFEWSDTNLVSLRNSPALAKCVPSKLYELMGLGRHITGVLSGESAEILTASDSGDLVEPGDVNGLVGLWSRLAANRELLVGPWGGQRWLAQNASPQAGAETYINAILQTLKTAR